MSGLSWPASHEGDCSFLLSFLCNNCRNPQNNIRHVAALFQLSGCSLCFSLMHTHARMHTHVCMHTHTHTHACMHSHMHVCKYKLSACEYAGFLIPVHPSCGCCNSTAWLFLHVWNNSHPWFFLQNLFKTYWMLSCLQRPKSQEVGGGGSIPNSTLSLPEWFCVKMGSNESHFNVSLIMRGKVTEQWVS